MWSRVKSWLASRWIEPLSADAFRRERDALLRRSPVPVFWLFGKTGSGKSSIIRYLTGAESATIGSGFRPETRQSFRFDFPATDSPIIEFLDTRGLGESGYDPAEDLATFSESTHLMIVTARALDHALAPVVEPLRKIRKAARHRPVVLALTCLHHADPHAQPPRPDPFHDLPPGALADPGRLPEVLPETLRRSIAEQARRFDGLVDAIVPLDFTRPEEGYDEPDFGGERLKQTLVDLLPAAYRQTFLTLEDVMASLRGLHERRAMPYILSASTMAASAAAVPLPWIDLPVVAAIQSDLIRRLAKLFHRRLDGREFLRFAGAIGGRMLARQVIRETLKVIPGVGQAASASVAFASTYALGRACLWYYGERLAGHAPTAEELRTVMHAQMQTAAGLWRRYHAPDAANRPQPHS
ncbi:MAG TPA: DUF697 domain-containing protein [Planctomycetaceae bacterium]|nr:DUF697 domain-containing protein [Planctomycetaceae bacterium]